MANPLMTLIESPRAKRRNSPPTPTSPRLATHRPMTAPPLKATSSALAWPSSLAACEVRTLAVVAAFMPKKPAAMEQTAPRM